MIILPAIDIINSECVRLQKGDYDTAHKVADSVFETLESFESAGAEWVHMVDLDGARLKKPANAALFLEAAKKYKIKIELGGGIRDIETVEFYLNGGISRIVLGSAALKNPNLVTESVRRFGDRIAVGIDQKNGFVSTEGWYDASEIPFLDFALRMEKAGVSYINYTNIDCDGMLCGPDADGLKRLLAALDTAKVIASGGIKDIEDIKLLKRLNAYGAICGKSIYSGTLDLKEAVKISKE